MLLAHVFGLPVEEFLGTFASGALPAGAAIVLASITSIVRRRAG